MGNLLKIGIVGCGAIGSSLAKAVVADFADKAKLAGLYDIDIEKAHRLASQINLQKLVALNLESLINKADFLIEATSADAVLEIARKALSASRSILIMSAGGIIAHYKELEILAQEKGRQFLIPSGAISGIDGLKAASFGRITKVTLTTKKPPKAFVGVPYVLKNKINLEKINEDTLIFEGNANFAVRAFPQNINVAATLSIAGVGPDSTVIRIIASPHINQNIHEIEIESAAGKIVTRTENVIHPDNPKTSYLAVLSAIATLKQFLSPMKIGT